MQLAVQLRCKWDVQLYCAGVFVEAANLFWLAQAAVSQQPAAVNQQQAASCQPAAAAISFQQPASSQQAASHRQPTAALLDPVGHPQMCNFIALACL